MRTDENLIAAAELFRSRNDTYKDNYKRAGQVFMALFPEGLVIRDAASYNRAAVLMNMVNKLLRYASNWETGHPDSLSDLAVYAMMMKELDDAR